mmetsp:Transcript_7098/g.23328  ORF Transcript_7098/g.23328 Transcript_7098/m.23328 type:complete len:244 (+) Transcript_7098:866-1597(+)
MREGRGLRSLQGIHRRCRRCHCRRRHLGRRLRPRCRLLRHFLGFGRLLQLFRHVHDTAVLRLPIARSLRRGRSRRCGRRLCGRRSGLPVRCRCCHSRANRSFSLGTTARTRGGGRLGRRDKRRGARGRKSRAQRRVGGWCVERRLSNGVPRFGCHIGGCMSRCGRGWGNVRRKGCSLRGWCQCRVGCAHAGRSGDTDGGERVASGRGRELNLDAQLGRELAQLAPDHLTGCSKLKRHFLSRVR